MINSRFALFLLLIIPSSLISQSILDRFNVPIYITSSLSTGYDSNIFRLSDFERNFEYHGGIPVIDANTFDDGYVVPKININYSPYIIHGIKTRFNFSLSRTHYLDTDDKSYNIISSELAIKLGSYRWLKFSHRYLPEYYLRNYIDHDSAEADYSTCVFSSESFGASFSNPIIKKLWSRIKYTRINLYYNIDFTEYDTEINQIELRLNSSYFKMNNSLWLSYADGNNISYGSGYESSMYDRSYQEYVLGYSSNKKIKSLPFLDRIGISSIIKNRVYNEESTLDPLHAGREHIEYNLSVWCEQKLNSSSSHQFKIKYRERNVFSNFNINYIGGTDIAHEVNISDLKSFEKFEFIYKIVFNTHLDFLF